MSIENYIYKSSDPRRVRLKTKRGHQALAVMRSLSHRKMSFWIKDKTVLRADDLVKLEFQTPQSKSMAWIAIVEEVATHSAQGLGYEVSVQFKDLPVTYGHEIRESVVWAQRRSGLANSEQAIAKKMKARATKTSAPATAVATPSRPRAKAKTGMSWQNLHRNDLIKIGMASTLSLFLFIGYVGPKLKLWGNSSHHAAQSSSLAPAWLSNSDDSVSSSSKSKNRYSRAFKKKSLKKRSKKKKKKGRLQRIREAMNN